MGKFNYFVYDRRIMEKLLPKEQEDLVFDLINAFSFMDTPFSSALLIQDLLTETEVMNLAKRLRIAKLILGGYTHDQIVKELHCSFATVSKVRIWLANAGQGLKTVIQKLPKRRKVYTPKKIPGIGYGLPQILAYYATLGLKNKEKKSLQEFLAQMRSKSATDRDFREEVNADFASLKRRRTKR